MDTLLLHKERTGETPPALLNRPQSNQVFEFYLTAFNTLDTTRPPSMGEAASISFSEICEYARIVGYTASSDILFFADVMMECDSVFIAFYKSRPKPTGDE